MSFDTKCHDLACHFLEDYSRINDEANRNALAQVIQTAIEDWIMDNYQHRPLDADEVKRMFEAIDNAASMKRAREHNLLDTLVDIASGPIYDAMKRRGQ